MNKYNNSVGIMKKLSLTLSRNSLLTIYRIFVRPILDYVDIIYDKPLTESFKDILEIVQYNAALVITVHLKVHHVTVFTESLVYNHFVNEDGLVRQFSSTKLKMIFYQYIYSHILLIVVNDFIEQDQDIKRTLDNYLQE